MSDIVKVYPDDNGGVVVYDKQRLSYWVPEQLLGRKIISIKSDEEYGVFMLELEEQEIIMADKEFELELYGVSGSGKSAFLKFIKKACSQSKEWTTEETEYPPSACPHHLLIRHTKPLAIPGLKADNQVEL